MADTEREAFEAWVRKDTGMPDWARFNWQAEWVKPALEGWMARAALASRPAEVDDQQPAPATTCTHSLTITRIGEGGAWCCHCGAKAFEVEFRECRGCEFYRRLSGLSMCKRYTMAVSPTMHATYRVSDGTCFVPAIGGGLTVGAQ